MDACPLETVWIVACGSRGDIQPYVAVGAAMVQRGYRVTFFTYNSYAKFAETFGMKGVSLGQDYESSIQTNDKIQKGMREGDTLAAFSGIAAMNHKNAPALCEAFLKELRESGTPDLCVAMPFSQYLAWYLYVQHGVPFLHMTTFAFAYNPDHMLLGLPKLPFGLTYYILHHLIVGGAYNGFKAYEDYMDAGVLMIFSKAQYIHYYKQPTLPMITLSSPEFVPVLYSSGLSPMWRCVGSTVIPRDEQVRNLGYFGGSNAMEEIEAFLNSGPKPVYLGWGSMICKSAEHMVILCVRAVQHAGRRAIVLGGAAQLSLDILTEMEGVSQDMIDYAKKNILFVNFAPHEWLFPRVLATVHHGGAGTVTAALRGGVPTIITPVFGDQFDFSYAVTKLGVGIGFTKQFQKIEWKELGDAIQKVSLDRDMAKRANQLGAKLRNEDGSTKAVDEMELYWKDYCQSGRIFELFPMKVQENQPTARIRKAISLVIVVVTVVASASFIFSTGVRKSK